MSSEPPPHTYGPVPVVYIRDFAGEVGQVGVARRWLRGVFGDHPLVDDAGLLVSEAATNAVLHARTGRFVVMAWVAVGWARVSVTDAGGTEIPCMCGRRAALGHGNGLKIMDATAERWGWWRDREQTTLWFDLRTSSERR